MAEGDNLAKIIHVTPLRGPNREERRAVRPKAVARLKKAKAWILVTFDGAENRLPSYSFETGALKDREDIRHVFMHEVAQFVKVRYENMRSAVEKKAVEIQQDDKVQEAKDRRSEELQKVEAA
jgi:hypothetical protein